MFEGAGLLLDWVVKLSAPLVLCAVSAATVVVGTMVNVPEASAAGAEDTTDRRIAIVVKPRTGFLLRRWGERPFRPRRSRVLSTRGLSAGILATPKAQTDRPKVLSSARFLP